jgi:phage terminase large subunit-like protein
VDGGRRGILYEEDYLACVTARLIRGAQVEGGQYLGVDIGTKHDTSAVVGVTRNGSKIQAVDHRVFVPGKQALNIEDTVEAAVLEMHERNPIMALYYDPYQFERSAQELKKKGIYCLEYPQSLQRTVLMSETLSTLITNQRLELYPSRELKKHLLNAKAKETDRGFRLVKSKKSKKIDLAVALAMACQAAVDMASDQGRVVVAGDGNERDWETAEEQRERIWNDPACWTGVA